MKILSECNLALLVSEVLNGKTVVFPTETSYGLGCDATNKQAVEKIFSIKSREQRKPLLVVVPNVEMAKKYLKWNEVSEKVAQKYWPGPLTMVADYDKAIPELPDGVVSAEGTLAVRVTDFTFLKSLTEMMGRPLVATSANISGAPSIYSTKEIIDTFEKEAVKPDIILNYGELPLRPATTLVRVYNDHLEVLRQGELVVEI